MAPANKYSAYVYKLLGITQPSWSPETRWPTSGVESFIKAPAIYSGALDRMYSGTQKRSPWQGPGAITTARTTGTMVNGTIDPNPNQMIPYRTQRALQSNSQWEWSTPSGPMLTDEYYQATYATAQSNSQSAASRIMGILARRGMSG